MSETKSQILSGVPETLLIALYLRAMETQRPDALIKDEKAVELVTRIAADEYIRYDFSQVRQIPMNETNKIVIILRNREFDRTTRNFLARNPEGVVVHIGCGLDSRFERVDNGQVEWYDLDMPEVIELRRKFIGDEGERYHLIGGSVLENAWLDTVSVHARRPFLFLAEGVFMYFKAEQVRSLVLTIRDHFPGSELAFDCYSPIHCKVHNFQLTTLGHKASAHWGIWHGQEIERWGNGIRLLGEWGFFDEPEPRLAPMRLIRLIDALFRTLRIYYFQLGKAAE